MLGFDDRLYEILLICTGKSEIKRVLYNSIKIEFFPMIGQSLMKLVDTSSKAKLLDSLYNAMQLHRSNYIEVNLVIGKKLYLLGMSIKQMDDKNLIIGIVSQQKTVEMYEELMRINNQAINQVRQLVQEREQILKYAVLGGEKTGDETEEYIQLVGRKYMKLVIDELNNPLKSLDNVLAIAGFFGMYKQIRINYEAYKQEVEVGIEDCRKGQLLLGVMACIIEWAQNTSCIEVAIEQWGEHIILKLVYQTLKGDQEMVQDELYQHIKKALDDQAHIWLGTESIHEHKQATLFFILSS